MLAKHTMPHIFYNNPYKTCILKTILLSNEQIIYQILYFKAHLVYVTGL